MGSKVVVTAAGLIVLAYASHGHLYSCFSKRGRALAVISICENGLHRSLESPFFHPNECALLCFLNPKSEFAHLFQTPMQWVSRKKNNKIKRNANSSLRHQPATYCSLSALFFTQKRPNANHDAVRRSGQRQEQANTRLE